MAVNCRVIKRGYCDIIQAYGVNGHLGVDLSNPIDKILAHSDGVVCMVQTGQVNNHNSTGNGTYGNFIKIDHGNGAFTLYAHLSEVYVGLGQQVKQGQEIGLMGDSGNAYGAHLHFEVWKNNARTNPADYLDRDLFLAVTPCVARDETQNQILVNVDNLNVRTDTHKIEM